ASTPLRVVLALNLHNQSALASSIRAHRTLTPAQFTASYAPTATQAQSVASYLTSKGFTGVAVASNRLLLTTRRTARQASAPFNTQIQSCSQHGRVVYANTADAQVPASLAGTVGAVLGLTNANVMRAAPKLAASDPSSCVVTGVGYPCTYNPQGFWNAYDAASAPTGSGTKVGIFAEGDVSGVVSDLRAEEAANGLAQ